MHLASVQLANLDAMLAALRVEILHAGYAVLRAIVVHAMNERLADYARTKLLGFRQIRIGGGRLRFGRATRPAPAAGDASGAAVPLHRVDGDGRREWMSTELQRATRQHLGMPVHAMWRHWQR